ncbi:hypothetical protein F909_00949 [Acinetobacter sp. ANC 3929]|uniref:hypothetical protein n=1 Tax=Acinetobacter sp. ANC 3929 TaxID=1217707 RepID=UPI0002D003D4|nr:hypothetical protein [Acinetobacter sp. ANC 3929]ENW82678.1 hypothetical protein F909_00949 [Acinetobacter sp. ANC 3929]
MYITKVLSYNGAWDELLSENNATFIEIKKILEQFSSNIHDPADWLRPDSPRDQFTHISERFEKKFLENGWGYPIARVSNRILRNSLGVVKNGLSLKMDNNIDAIPTFIFKKIKINNIGNVTLPTLVTFNTSTVKDGLSTTFTIANSIVCTFENAYEDLIELLPNDFNTKFLIFGIDKFDSGFELVKIDIKKSESIKIDRCITFEPEYYQAGLSILSYFGTVLRDKYPEQNATVRIEQHDLNVRMVIQSENGNIETIEKALHEYELLLKGETSPDEFAISPLKALELKNQLNLFKFQVESQKEIIALQNGQILDLKQIIHKALSPISHPPVTIINQLHNSQSTVINHKAAISESNDELEELIDLADSETLKNKLAMIQNALESNRNSENPEEIKDSNGMKKLAKFLKEANEVGTEANDLAEKGGKAVDLIKSLGRSYNSIAQWCGMPVIPSVFVKE